jgi:hypothetical protein
MTWGDFLENKWLNINEETVHKKIMFSKIKITGV